MNKAKIKLITIGHMPLHLNLARVTKWKSEVFELAGEIENYALRCESDSDGWVFSDVLLKNQLPENGDANFLIALVNVAIEDNWYSRRIGGNQVVFTFSQIKDYLNWENIPLENVVLRVLYAYTLLYRRAGDKIPSMGDTPGFTHDETRGCLFDMNGIKSDLVESCNKPVVCPDCVERLMRERVSTQTIKMVQREIKVIRKQLYYRFVDFVKVKPLISLFISSLFALFLGIVGSLLASYIYDEIKPQQAKLEGMQSNERIGVGRIIEGK